ncbi:hypothetical protein P40081_15245 [Paenibacillus sp. FSL P4-0081]|uniref:AAA family ATPase n=1 Tax=Paenibacillus sp. FSL P4-0081 TaxID=1536769 RepID=UPI0004F62E0E|nr:AAA family ATPase [Paenibacillus sp. FSL P4-0081]AIQ29353.1 hypothetical protein P40081_15245 [Paenibacillus sp. FSL P4-0081]
MEFKVLSNNSSVKEQPGGFVYLVADNWNDWYEFWVLYQAYYKNERDVVTYIGPVKFGNINMVNGVVDLPREFSSLGQTFFSLGQDSFYYENLNRIGDKFRDDLLRNLKDVALDLELFSEIQSLRVTYKALLRDFNSDKVRDTFHYLALGNSSLTYYDFDYLIPKSDDPQDGNYKLAIKVVPDSTPPTNIHAIIGRNGVGKTHLLNQMAASLMQVEGSVGTFKHDNPFEDEEIFNHIIYISFSAFDDAKILEHKRNNDNSVTYSYIGLKEMRKLNVITDEITKMPKQRDFIETKSTKRLREELVQSIWSCRETPSKRARLEQAIDMLGTDPIFAVAGVRELLHSSETEERLLNNAVEVRKQLTREESESIRTDFYNRAILVFEKFSSGHSIVLLTITKLIEELREKTLVLLDEPESHLHPPLLSTFTRILSSLLIKQNGVGLIATHSPVVLQEIPQKCVSIFNRSGRNLKFETPSIETFGENINTLTKEVFSFEVTNSGFHRLLQEAVDASETYKDALNFFNNELGMEARVILSSLMDLKETRGE